MGAGPSCGTLLAAAEMEGDVMDGDSDSDSDGDGDGGGSGDGGGDGDGDGDGDGGGDDDSGSGDGGCSGALESIPKTVDDTEEDCGSTGDPLRRADTDAGPGPRRDTVTAAGDTSSTGDPRKRADTEAGGAC